MLQKRLRFALQMEWGAAERFSCITELFPYPHYLIQLLMNPAVLHVHEAIAKMSRACDASMITSQATAELIQKWNRTSQAAHQLVDLIHSETLFLPMLTLLQDNQAKGKV